MKKRKARSSSMFLLELLFAILFFAISSAICVQIFVKAHTLSRNSDALNDAVAVCSSIADLTAASSDKADLITKIKEAYPLSTENETGLVLCFDEEAADLAYTEEAPRLLTVTITEEADLIQTDMTYESQSGGAREAVYSLTACHHPERRAS